MKNLMFIPILSLGLFMGNPGLTNESIEETYMKKNTEQEKYTYEILQSDNNSGNPGILQAKEKSDQSHPMEDNLTAVSLTLSNNFTAEDAINILGRVKNTGTSVQSESIARFFLGNPDSGGTQIGEDMIIPSLLPDQTAINLTIWNGFSGSSNIYYVVDPSDSLLEDNENDNVDSLFVSMCDSVPWIEMDVLGLCHYAVSTMIFNLFGAENTLYETMELVGCPHSFLCIDDQFWFLGGTTSLSHTEGDHNFAGTIRNLSVDIETESSWEPYLTELKSRIDIGLPVETNIDQYYLPQVDYDTLRVSGTHHGHWILVTGYTDSSVIINDTGVGLPNLDQTPIPDPENRGANVIVDLEDFRTGIETTSGTRFRLLSYSPVGPIPSHETMLGDALERSIGRLGGNPASFDPYWIDNWPQTWVLSLGTSALSVMRNNLNINFFETVYDSVLISAGGNLDETLSTFNHMCSGMYDCKKGWIAAANYYESLERPEADDLARLFLQLVPIGERITDNFWDMLEDIRSSAGDPSVAEPYLAELTADFDLAIPLEDSVLVYLTAPVSYTLYQNYPNPFNPRTTIIYDIPGTPGEKRPARLTVYDLRGRHINTLVDTELESGRHAVMWSGKRENGRPVPSGTYLYTMKIGKRTYTRKMVVLK
jgi:hypothetical protein